MTQTLFRTIHRLSRMPGSGSLASLRLTLLLLTAIFACREAQGQTDPQFTQYWALPSYYNPGAAGQTDFIRIRGAARLQWLGIHNAPRSFAGTADMPLQLFGKRFGIGASVTQESLGLFSNLTAGLQAAYTFRFGKKCTLSAGLQAGLFNSKFKGSETYIPEGDDYHQTTDPYIPTQDLTGTAFDLGAGIWFNHPLVSLGLSGMHLLKPSVSMRQEGSTETSAQEYKTEVGRMMYFTGIGNIGIKNSLFVLQPSLLIRTDFSMFQAEITARATYNRFIFAALGYRLNDAVSISAGVEIKNFFLGYAYDYPLSAIGKASSGSHELVAGYQLKLDLSGKNRNSHRSVRLM